MIPVQVKKQVKQKVLEALEAYFVQAEEMEDDAGQASLDVQARLLDFWLYQYNAGVI